MLSLLPGPGIWPGQARGASRGFCVPQALLLAFVLGLVAADQAGPGHAVLMEGLGGNGREASRLFWGLAVGFCPLVAGSAILWSRCRGVGAADRVRSGVCGCWALALVLSLGAGFVRLAPSLAAAQRDASRVEFAALEGRAPSPIRLLEAEVAHREDRAWGSELTLSRAVATDGRSAIPKRLRLRLWRDSGAGVEGQESRADRLLWPGARVRLGVRLAPLYRARNPGRSDREREDRRRGLAAQARLVAPDWVVRVQPARPSWDSVRVDLHAGRAALRRRVQARFSSAAAGGAGLGLALSLGDRSGLSGAVREGLRALGISHLIAISGLHVGIVGGGAAWLIRRLLWTRLGGGLRDRFRLTATLVGAALSAAVYAWLSGGAPSVQRAAFVFGLLVVLRLLGRSVAPVRALAIAGLGLLLVEPATFFDLGARLSFAACAGLACSGVWTGAASDATPAVPEPRFGFAGWVGSATRGSLAVSFATAPLLASAGLPTPPWAPLVNLVAIPLTTLIVLPASLIALVCAQMLPAGGWAWALLPARAMEVAVVWLGGEVPELGGRWGLGSVGVWSGALLGLVLLRRGGVWLPLLVWFAGTVLEPAPSLGQGRIVASPRVVFFDVGQGDAALIQGRETSILIDAGGGARGTTAGEGLLTSLRALGVGRIDVLAISHGDADHRQGAARVMQDLAVGALWLPDGAQQDGRLQGLAGRARALEIPVVWRATGDAMRWGDGLGVEVLWPPREDPDVSRRASWNDLSMVLRVHLNGRVLLFTGDIGSEVEANLVATGAPLRADLLKVAHHGSRASSAEAFLQAVSPRLAVLSAPCLASRGLPHPEVLARLRRYAEQLAWTGRDGAISVSLGAQGALDGVGWAASRPCPSPTLTAQEARWSALDEGALGFAGIFGPAQGSPERLLPRIGLRASHSLELSKARESRLDREGGVGSDLVGGFEGSAHQVPARDDFVDEADREGVLRADGLCGVEQLGGVDRPDLMGKEDRRVSGRVEAERHFLEREGRLLDGETDLAGQHQVEAAGSGMSVDRGHEGNAEPGLHQRRAADRPQTLKVPRLDSLAARERLGGGDGSLHVHPRTKTMLTGACQHRDAERFVFVDPLPVVRELAECCGVERVGVIGSVEGDEGNMGMLGGSLEAGGHGGSPAGWRRKGCRGRVWPRLARTRGVRS